MNIVIEFFRTSERMLPSGTAAEMPCSLQRSDFLFSTTSASMMLRGRKSAIPEVRDTLTMKLLRPHSALRVCSTRDFSPTLVTASIMSWTACVIAHKFTIIITFAL